MPRTPRFSNALHTHVIRHGIQPFLESTRTLIALLDPDGRVLARNPAFAAIHRDEELGEGLLQLVAPLQREAARQLLGAARRDQKPVRGPLEFAAVPKALHCDCLLVPAGGKTLLLFAEPMHADLDLVAANEDLRAELNAARSALADKTSELHAVVAQADELAHTDSLTFLPNRRSIIADLQHQVMYAERYGTPLAISMMDLDDFKSVNDRSGHPTGDKILTSVARSLRGRIRQPDQIGRYGGDEFLVLLPNSTAAAASEQASRLCQHIRSTPVPFADTLVHLTLSAGIAQFSPGVDTWQSLLERADRALYEAKRLGGNQWLILET